MADVPSFKRGDKLSADWANNVSRATGMKAAAIAGLTDKDGVAFRPTTAQKKTVQVKNTGTDPILKNSVFEIDIDTVVKNPNTIFNVKVAFKTTHSRVLCTNPFADIPNDKVGHCYIIPTDGITRVLFDTANPPKPLEMCGPVFYGTGIQKYSASSLGCGLIALSKPDAGTSGLIECISGHLFEYEGTLVDTLAGATPNGWVGATTSRAVFWEPDPTDSSTPQKFRQDPASRVFTLTNRMPGLKGGINGTYVSWRWINNEWRINTVDC